MACDELAFRLDEVKWGPEGFGHGADEEHNPHRKQQDVEAEAVEDAEPKALLKYDDLRQVEGACVKDERDEDEANRDFVAPHLRCRAQSREEWVFRVRRPAGDDHPVNPKRARREDV